MEVTFTIPDDIAAALQNGSTKPLSRRALELLAIDWYNSDQITLPQMQIMLGCNYSRDFRNRAIFRRGVAMMPITSEQIELLPNEELRPLLKAMLAELESLRQRVAELEAENQQLKQRLDKSTNSRNSSQPPSRDQKPNQPADKPRKKHAARFGHQKFSRPLVDKPDHIIQVPVTECEHCHEDLSRVEPEEFTRRQIVSENGVYHTIVPTRSFAEIETVLGELAVKAWGSDCFGAQLKAPAEVFQLCLSHQLRDLQKVPDATPEEGWAQVGQKLFREAIHLRNRFQSGEMKLDGFSRRVTEIENKLDRLLEKELANEAAEKLRTRFVKHRDKLLTFLHYSAVPPTNNESEQALRANVIHRKVTNGFRSEWGAKAYAALQTILATAKQKGEDAFQTLANRNVSIGLRHLGEKFRLQEEARPPLPAVAAGG